MNNKIYLLRFHINNIRMKKIIIGITGASGVIYGIRLLEILNKLKIETHLILTNSAKKVLKHETHYTEKKIISMATHHHDESDIAASLASGSFKTDAMVIIPCSAKTLAGIATGYSTNLVLRAAEVCIKERRKLVLVPRETPVSYIQLKNMLHVTTAGAIVLPASPGFYHKPKNVNNLVDYVVGKVLDSLDIEHEIFKRWK